MEPCCGDIARCVGEDGLYEEQMEECLKLFGQYEINELVTSSPHCFHTIRNEYPNGAVLIGNNGQVPGKIFHYSQMLKAMISDGAIVFDKPVPSKITYHDPCYLGRHNRIFSDPRDVVKAIPGVEFVEMTHTMENSLCCGSGGGRMWQGNLDKDIRMSDIRIQEAAATGSDIVVTACPLCLLMLEDATKTNGLENSIRVMDLNELVAMALGLQ
jgi:Fe-S oxidoreductase